MTIPYLIYGTSNVRSCFGLNRLPEMSTVLITGGAGFIGCRLGSRLAAEGHTVIAADALHPQVHPTRLLSRDFPASCTFMLFDVTVQDSWEPMLSHVQPDTVIHLAAETGTGQSLTEASRHATVNVVGTTRLVDAMSRLNRPPNHVVLASSRAVYGDGLWKASDGSLRYPGNRSAAQLRNGLWDHYDTDGSALMPLPSAANHTQTNPTNIYAATKLAQEHVLEAWCTATETALSILRLQNVYGPGQSISNSYTGVLTYMAREALIGNTIDVYEDGKIIRDFVFIDDVVSALVAAVNNPPATKRKIDIGSGVSTTIATVASLIADVTGSPAPVTSGRYREGDVRAASCSIDAAKNEIDYSPATELKDGIGHLVESMRNIV